MPLCRSVEQLALCRGDFKPWSKDELTAMKETGDKEAAKLERKVKADLPKQSSLEVRASVPPPTMRREDIAERTPKPSILLL